MAATLNSRLFPTRVYLRLFIALLAAAAALPQAAAEDCEWPESGDTAPAQAAGPGGVRIASPDELPIEVTSGAAEVTREGNATLSNGVVMRQGDRRLTARSASYDSAGRRFKVEGDVEYRDPELRLKGGSGFWSADGGGEFTGTEFELPARPARGAAAKLGLAPTAS